MILLLFYSAIIHFALSSCPAGFELVGSGQCRQLQPHSVKGNLGAAVNDAISTCDKMQAQPVIIRNDEEQAYWNGHKQSTEFIILGIVCNTTSKKNEWTDGSTINYKPPAGPHDVTAACTTGGTWYMIIGGSNDGRWWYYSDPETYNYDVYCITQLQQPVLPSVSCLGFDDDKYDEICYQIGPTAENWQDAQMACKEVGANLASIHNTNENSFIRRMAVSAGAVHGVFLGATITGKGDSYGWIDGSAWDYVNFNDGFHGFGDCVAMDTSTSSGQWMNVDCTAKLPVVCIRERATIHEQNVTCNIQTMDEGKIITSPGFPTDASKPCDYYLTVDAGKKVEVEIIVLEANSCCDFLILDEGYFGGFEIAHLTGEIQNKTYRTSDSNIMKVSWMPNGGVNVRGMAMTFRGV